MGTSLSPLGGPLGQRGFTLIESLVAVFLLGMTAVASVAMSSFITRVQTDQMDRSNLADLKAQLTNALKNPDICLQNFSGKLNVPKSPGATTVFSYTELGYKTNDGMWTPLVRTVAAVPDVAASKYPVVETIKILNFRKIDADTFMADVQLQAQAAKLAAVAPIVLSNLQIQMDPLTRANSTRPVTRCLASYLTDSVYKGVAVGSPTVIPASDYSQTKNVAVPGEASAVAVDGFCELRASSGATELSLTLRKGGTSLITVPVCVSNGTSSSETRDVQATRVLRLPDGSDNMNLTFTFPGSGINRNAKATVSWYE